MTDESRIDGRAARTLLYRYVGMGGHLLAVYDDRDEKRAVRWEEGGGWARVRDVVGLYRKPGADPVQVAERWAAGAWKPAIRPGTVALAALDGDDARWRRLARRWTPALVVHESAGGAHMYYAHPAGRSWARRRSDEVVGQKNGVVVDGAKFDVRGDVGYIAVHSLEDLHAIVGLAELVRRGRRAPLFPRIFVGDDIAPGSADPLDPTTYRRALGGSGEFGHAGAVGVRRVRVGAAMLAEYESMEWFRDAVAASATGGTLFGPVRRFARLVRWAGLFGGDADAAWAALAGEGGTDPHVGRQVARGFNAGWTDDDPFDCDVDGPGRWSRLAALARAHGWEMPTPDVGLDLLLAPTGEGGAVAEFTWATPVVRIWWANLEEPYTVPRTGDKQYSVSVVLNAAGVAAAWKFASALGGEMPSGARVVGDVPGKLAAEDSMAAGVLKATAPAKFPPRLAYADRSDVPDDRVADEFHPGRGVRLGLFAVPYDFVDKGGKRVVGVSWRVGTVVAQPGEWAEYGDVGALTAGLDDALFGSDAPPVEPDPVDDDPADDFDDEPDDEPGDEDLPW